MDRFRFLSKRVVVIILLLLVIVGMWFYEAMYGSTSEALRRAENFLFTRQTVSRLADQDKARYFFITNRKKSEDEDEDPEARFSSQREPGLKFGRFDASIEPSIGLGMFINPSEWFQTEEILVNDLQTLTRDAFVSELVTLVDVTLVNRTRNFHNFSLETPEFFDDLFLRLVNRKTPHSRGLYHLKTSDGASYWGLTPGR